MTDPIRVKLTRAQINEQVAERETRIEVQLVVDRLADLLDTEERELLSQQRGLADYCELAARIVASDEVPA